MGNVKKEVKKVDFLSEEDKKTYTVTKEQALERLKELKITKSEQMLNKWCRDAEIDAVRIVKGNPKDRGILLSERSLEAFIQKKTGNIEALLERIAKLEADNKVLQEENEQLKAKGIVVPKQVKLEEIKWNQGKMEFRFNRAIHVAHFEGDTLVKVEKKGRGKSINDVTESVDENLKEAILKEKKAQ
ncbi:hypothetical protein QRE62_03530 (plasmid) [Bacillus mycoides]|uniref:hypothetical protein n=1 Tax=Bacillus mycoides TaxID=1405 RepID=UPI00257110B9|nr:hypothetical protein [Bacillus mycoides]WJE74194.1 hypothetical protein QRE62_03530 [Bacillus mycoides]